MQNRSIPYSVIAFYSLLLVACLAPMALQAQVPNIRPKGVIDFAVFSEPGETIEIEVLLNDLDLNNDDLSIASFSPPHHGTASISDNNTILYTPDESFNNIDRFRYIVCDDASPKLCDVARIWVVKSGLGLLLDNDALTELFGSIPVNEFISNNDSLQCLIDCVWPGDINRDGIVNRFDALGVGIAFGRTGPNRPMGSGDYIPQTANDWAGDLFGGINSKHADCNGDGVVNLADLNVIFNNYNPLHTDYEPYFTDPSTPDIFVDFENQEVLAGSEISIPIMLGTAENTIADFYGIAFNVSYDTSLVDQSSTRIEYNESWVGSEDEVLTLSKNFPNKGKLEAAISRKNGETVTGGGEIARLILVMEEVLAGKKDNTQSDTLSVVIKAVRNNGTTGNFVRMGRVESQAIVNYNIEENPLSPNNSTFRVFPNPNNGQFYVGIAGSEQEETYYIHVYNTIGQLLHKQELSSTAPVNIPIQARNSATPGIYCVVVRNKKGKLLYSSRVLVNF